MGKMLNAAVRSGTGGRENQRFDGTDAVIADGYQEQVAPGDANWQTQAPATVADVERIVREAISELRVYVLEADITDAQNAVRTVVEKVKY